MSYFKLWVVGVLSIIPIIIMALFLLKVDSSQKNIWSVFFLSSTCFIKIIQNEIILDKTEKEERDRKANEPITKIQGIKIACFFLGIFLTLSFIGPILNLWLMKISGPNAPKAISMILLIIFMGEGNVRAWKKYRCDSKRKDDAHG